MDHSNIHSRKLSLKTSALEKNGFNLNNSLIDVNLILRGGPPKDGIPALDTPLFIDSDKASYLADDDRVLGVLIGQTAKAYPIRVLNWHEVVNDQVEGTSLVVSYCPLCATGAVFSSVVDNKVLSFGVSGLLYNSDVLLYDRQSESLWSQIHGQSISGPFARQTLEQLPVTHTSWKRWREQHPDTLVLSVETGYNRDYSRNPYGDYSISEQLFFPVEHEAPHLLHPKETVLGVSIDSGHKAYPFSTLKLQGKKIFSDSLNGKKYTVIWDEEGNSAKAVSSEGIPLQQIQGFWFAWFAFHPTTKIYSITQP
jgi:hypothetical protein